MLTGVFFPSIPEAQAASLRALRSSGSYRRQTVDLARPRFIPQSLKDGSHAIPLHEYSCLADHGQLDRAG